VLAAFAGTPAAADAQQPYRPGPAQAATFNTPFPSRTNFGGGTTAPTVQAPDGKPANTAATATGNPPRGYRPATGGPADAPNPPGRGSSAGFGGGKVMYFRKSADALTPDGPPDAGTVALAAGTTPLPDVAPVPDVPTPVPGFVPLPAVRPAFQDRPISAPSVAFPAPSPVVAFPPIPPNVPGASRPEPPAKPDPQPKGEPQPKPSIDQVGPKALPAEVTQLPTRDKIFLMYDDRALERAIIQSVAIQIKSKDSSTLVFPPLPAVVPPGTPFVSKTASYPPNKAVYEPGFVVHRRLHFEERNAERAGWDLGFAQPLVSAAYFYKDVLLWPNSLGSSLEIGPWDTSAGKCLPGSPTPYYLYPPGLTVTGMVFEAGVFTGGGFLLHPVGGGNGLGPFVP